MSIKYKTPEGIKKAMQKMLERPERFDPASIVQEKDDSGKYSVENPDKPYSVPAQIKKGLETDFDEPETEHETDDSGEIKHPTSKKIYETPSEITELVRKISKGVSIDDEDQQEVESTIEDSSADKESRKQAIQKIKQKYLGR
jgi:hypothetical protein